MLMYEKQRHHFANKGLYSQSYGFSSSQVGCESWTIRKAEHQRIDAFKLWCWRRLLRVPWTAERSNQSKGNQPWIFIRRTDVEAEAPILWPPDAKELTHWKIPWERYWEILRKILGKIEGGRRKEQQRMRWLDGITDSIDMNLGDCRRQRSLACHSPWGHKELDINLATEQQQ